MSTGPHITLPGSEILLTGATGFFGAFLLAELLDTTQQQVNCLIRAKDEQHARQRVRQNLLHYHRWNPSLSDRITVTVGDLTEPRLGLSEKEFVNLTNNIGTIYHNGALVNHLLPLTHLHAANVDSTRALIELTTTATPKKLHYMSANAVAEGHDTGYTESKRQSEEMIRDAAADGVPASIYRLPRLAPDSRTGLPNENDIAIRLLDVVLQVGSAPDIKFTEIWVAVDVAASTIVQAAARSTGGETFSLGSKEGVSLHYLLEIAEEVGFSIPVEPLDQWVHRVRTLNSSEYEVTLGVLGLDGVTVAEPDDDRVAGHDDKYGDLVEASRITGAALSRYFSLRLAGF